MSWSVSNLTFQPFGITGLQRGIRCMFYLFKAKGHVVKCQDSSFGMQCCLTSAVPNVRLMSTNNCFTCFNRFMLVFMVHRLGQRLRSVAAALCEPCQETASRAEPGHQFQTHERQVLVKAGIAIYNFMTF